MGAGWFLYIQSVQLQRQAEVMCAPARWVKPYQKTQRGDSYLRVRRQKLTPSAFVLRQINLSNSRSTEGSADWWTCSHWSRGNKRGTVSVAPTAIVAGPRHP